MAQVAARCVLKSASGQARHDCINTFYFDGANFPGTDDDIVFDALERFYTFDNGTGDVVADYINDTILRVSGLIIELILSPDVPPNTPYNARAVDLPNPIGSPFPQEVAACLSFVTAFYDTALAPGRNRGRVYVGPLITGAGIDGGTAQPCRLSSNFQTTLAAAGSTLKSDTDTGGVQWSIFSRATPAFFHVDRGWVDNEFDTQRRRQWDPSGRLYWS